MNIIIAMYLLYLAIKNISILLFILTIEHNFKPNEPKNYKQVTSNYYKYYENW